MNESRQGMASKEMKLRKDANRHTIMKSQIFNNISGTIYNHIVIVR